MARKKSLYTYDRVSKRWRKSGKWSKPPKRSQLATDSAGRLRDAKGKLVPASAVAAPKLARKPPRKPKARPKPRAKPRPKPKPKPKKRPAPVRSRPSPRTPKPRPRLEPLRLAYVADGEAFSRHNIASSTFENVKGPSEIAEIFVNLVRKKADRAGVDVEDLTFFKSGVQFVHTSGGVSPEAMTRAVQYLAREYPQYSFYYNEEILHVFAGKEGAVTTVQGSYRSLHHARHDFVAIWEYLEDFWDGDIGWFVEFESDELEGGS